MKPRNRILLLASLAAGLALPGAAGAADRPQDSPPLLSSGRIAGTIDLHADGRVVRRQQRPPVTGRTAPDLPPTGLPAAGLPDDPTGRFPPGHGGRTIRTSAP